MIQNDVRIIIPNMGEKKKKLIGDTLDRILKKWVDSYIFILAEVRNNSLGRDCFPDQLKFDEVTPVFRILGKTLVDFVTI